VRSALDDAVYTIARDFLELEFYKTWHEKHQRRLRLDSADALQVLLETLAVVSVDMAGKIAALFEKSLLRAEPRDTCRDGAAREELRALGDRGLRFVVYGHTHSPRQAALRADADAQDMYLNTGTFRQGVFRTDDHKGFIGWERMTYLCFYRADESGSGAAGSSPGPGFETWTGARCR
jgi:hypothetical protein